MAIRALRYEGLPKCEEARNGAIIYDGSAHRFKEWKCHNELEIEVARQGDSVKDRVKKTTEIVKALRKEAADIAQDIGREALFREDGIATLVEALRKHAFPKIVLEAKELYMAGHESGGSLSRQPGESMHSYTNRRKRWWRDLTQMDNSIQLSNETVSYTHLTLPTMRTV